LGLGLEDLIDAKKLSKIRKDEIKSMQKAINFLKLLNKPVYLIYGNNDYLNKEASKLGLNGLEKRIKHSRIRLIRQGTFKLKNIKLIGYSGFTSRLAKVNKFFSKSNNISILVTHVPAYGYFDRVKLKESPLIGKHVGDKNFLKMIKKYQPLLHISSHMHEHQGKKKN